MDEEDENEICCPFCGEADGCKHLLAAFDHGNAVIAGGILFDREEEITELVRKGFESLFDSRGASVDWGHAPCLQVSLGGLRLPLR